MHVDLHTTENGARTSSAPGAAPLPSPPTDRELAILRRVLDAATVDGVECLRDQLRMLQVAPVSDATCRIYLVHPDAPRSAFARDGRSSLPTRFPVRTPLGRLTGEITVWVQHGHLCALQYVGYGPTVPILLPPAEWIELPEPEVPIAIRARAAQQALAGVQVIGEPPVPELEQPPADAPAEAAAAAAAPPAIAAAPDVAAARAPREPATVERPWLRYFLWATLALCVLALAIVAFVTAYGRGADVAGARTAGAMAGSQLGAEHGEIAGRFAGDVEGRAAGRSATYPSAFVASRNRTQAELRRAATERQQARASAAATPPPSFTPVGDVTTCPGYRDADGFWICT